MSGIKKYIGDLYLTTRFYLALGLCIVLFIVSFFVPDMFTAVKIILMVITALIFIDYLFLFLFEKVISPTLSCFCKQTFDKTSVLLIA